MERCDILCGKNGALSFVQTHLCPGDNRHVKTRQFIRLRVFLLDPAIKGLEVPLATAIMADKRQELSQTTAAILSEEETDTRLGYLLILQRCDQAVLLKWRPRPACSVVHKVACRSFPGTSPTLARG